MKLALGLAVALLCAGCASMLTGSDEAVTVMADAPAACSATNDKGTYPVARTPGTVTVHRSAQPLLITCTAADSRVAQAVAAAQDNAVSSFATGGLIGWAIDSDSGAAYSYPNVVMVTFK